MAVLNAARRKKLPKSAFGGPGEDKYPMPEVIRCVTVSTKCSILME